MHHSYEGLGPPRRLQPRAHADATSPPRLPPHVGRDVRVAARRRHLPRRDGVAGLRAVRCADRAVARRQRDDGADDRVPAARRRGVRPLRPPPGDARRRPRPGAAVALLAALSIAGALALWHVAALVPVYGAGAAFSGPSFDAVVPDVLPASELARANSLDQFVRPVALRLAGPALGGALIDAVGVGPAFAVDAASFGISALALVSMAARTPG